MSSIKFEQVNKKYGSRTIIKDLTLEIKNGERLILLGPSGCGKSTILRMIAGFEKLNSGHLFFDDTCIDEYEPGERNISMVFQNYALFPHMNVWDNITFGLKIQKLPKDEIKKRTNKALEITHLMGYEKHYPHQLSGGQKQRVALCRALVKQSHILLLDEPLSNLDAKLRQEARQQLVNIHNLFHQTMIYVTHDQIEAMTVADRIAIINEGIMQQCATPNEIYNNPVNTFVATFIGAPSMNLIKAQLTSKDIVIGDLSIPLPDNLQFDEQYHSIYIGVRPEVLSDTLTGDGFYIPITVNYLEDSGTLRTISLQSKDNQNIYMQVSDRNKQLDFSQGCAMHWDNLYFFDSITGNNIFYKPWM